VKAQRVAFSDAAVADILDQADWFQGRSSDHRLAQRWEKAVTTTVLRVSRTPLGGALCAFGSRGLRGVRRVPVADFPKYLIFYRPSRNSILILRVVYGARDLESLFSL